jgi:hypothetical protein
VKVYGGLIGGLRAEVLEWIAQHHYELMEEWQRWHP